MTNIITTGEEGDVFFTPYKSYVAMLNQVDEDPVIPTVVNENDSNFLGNIVWTRDSPGVYSGTLIGLLTVGKTWYTIQNNISGSAYAIYASQLNVNTLRVFTETNPDGTSIDGQLVDTPIEIRVYP